MSKIIVMWAHQRAVSTAFLRMMIARGDVTVIHEPFVTLIDTGEVPLPDGRGNTTTARSEQELINHLEVLAQTRPVFFKDTVEHRYRYLFEHPHAIAHMEHTFMVREPRNAISSLYAMKPSANCAEVGYEHLVQIFELVWRLQDRRPVVICAEKLLQHPATVVEKYCEAVGLPFLPQALQWQPEDRPEWQRTARWHQGAAHSAGFRPTENRYEVTVDNDAALRAFYDYHYPFYERLARHAI